LFDKHFILLNIHDRLNFVTTLFFITQFNDDNEEDDEGNTPSQDSFDDTIEELGNEDPNDIIAQGSRSASVIWWTL